MLVVLGKVDHVVNRQSNQNDDCDRLGDAELPTMQDHDGDHTDNHNADTQNGPKRQQHIASDPSQYHESEDEGDQHSLLRGLNKGLLCNHPSKVNACRKLSTLQALWRVLNVRFHVVLPFFVYRIQFVISVPLLAY